jgi:hypothetical protein
MPFLQAFVAAGFTEELEPYGKIMSDAPFLEPETCHILGMTAQQTRPDDEDMKNFISDKFCKETTP